MAIISRLNINIEDLNKKFEENVYRLIGRAEEAFQEQICEIANNIKNNNKKIILLTGPSSAGKTTTSFKIQKELSKLGIKSFVLNMDDFFKDLDTVKLRKDGKPDMEGIAALDVDMIKKCLNELLNNGKTTLPSFDFKTHKRTNIWTPCEIETSEVVIMEGIHALNSQISSDLDITKIYKIYIHCNTNFRLNKKILMSARELRLLRRIVRDERTRHAPFEETLNLWHDVCKGEKNNIRRFKNEADYFLNSTHFYEPFLYKYVLQKKFLEMKSNKVVADYLEKFKFFCEIDDTFIPKDSLVREFIGNQTLE